MIYIGCVDREIGEKAKLVKIHVFNPSYMFRVRIQNLRSIVIQNETVRRNMDTKKMIFGR